LSVVKGEKRGRERKKKKKGGRRKGRKTLSGAVIFT